MVFKKGESVSLVWMHADRGKGLGMIPCGRRKWMTAEVNGRRSRGRQKKRWGDMIQQGSPIKERTYW